MRRVIESYASDSQSVPGLCGYCGGDGARRYVVAYAPGPDPFDFAAVRTVTRLGACRNCRGTGLYDARQDPALAHHFRDEDAEAEAEGDEDAEEDEAQGDRDGADGGEGEGPDGSPPHGPDEDGPGAGRGDG